MRYSTPIRIIAMILVLVLTWNSVSVGAVSAAMMNQEFGVQTVTPNSNETSSGADSSDAATESEAAQTLPVYEDGTILLYTYEQLQLVATGVVLRSQGAPVLAEDGVAVTYSPDASYRIAQDIALPAGMLWQVPGFLTGRIEPAQNAAERPLYDAETDTIYIYNPYQLAVMAMDDAAEQPVMSNDADAATVGMGKLTILEDGSFLTYSPEHNYVISSQFDSALPEKSYATVNQNELQTAAPMAEGETATESVTEPVTEPEVTEPEIEAQAEVGLGGPVFTGQVVKTVDGVQYIMLGSTQQIHAIGTGAPVYTAVYQKYSRRAYNEWKLDKDPSGKSILLYPGDAELGANATLSAIASADEDLSQYQDIVGQALYYEQGRAGVDQNSADGAAIINSKDNTWVTGLTYSRSARYIIFRDIELSNKQWTLPIDFNGEIVPAEYPTTRELYNQSTGTLYIHNSFQLRAMYFSGKTATVVHANDAYVDQFGTGAVVTKSDGTALTYGDLNTKHVMSRYFGSAIPEGAKLDRDGRDFPGQVLRTVNGEQYILIGNELQMQKIGTQHEVWRPVYQWANDAVDTRKDTGMYIMRYPGDTDLYQVDNGYNHAEEFTYHVVREGDKTISNSGATTYKAAVNQTTGEIDNDLGPETGVYYTASANYTFVRDIKMTGRWNLPVDFTGKVVPVETPAIRELYDRSTNTLYIHNMFQLRSVYFSHVETIQVHENDAYADRFGTGDVVKKADGTPLTYGDLTGTNHMISKYFGSEIPDGTKLDRWGRDIPGQVVMTGVEGEGENQTTVHYILIGNETQLRKIGTTTSVYRPIYQWVDGGLDNRKDNGMYIMRYPGDADLLESQNGYAGFDFQTVKPADSSVSMKSGTRYQAGVDQETGAIKNSLDEDSGYDYTNDAKYLIFRDITLVQEDGKWKIPDAFTGEIRPLNDDTAADRPLYTVDASGHVTVYIYNALQLQELNAGDAATRVINANDAYVAYHNTGEELVVNGQPLTYSNDHTYVISQYFSSYIPDDAARLAKDSWGRDFPGQVVKTIDGEKYILIGNAQQLRAIGTDAKVFGAVYQTIGASEKLDEHKDGGYIMRYSGDADLIKDHNGYGDFTFGVVNDADKSVSTGLSTSTRAKAGVNQETGEIDKKLDEDTGLTYSSTANYIIFRDIDLNNEAWEPLMFSGTMIGVQSPNNYTMLWNGLGNNATKIVITARPVISNIKVEQASAVEVADTMGIGFFATISNQFDKANIGVVGKEAKVINLELHDVTVSTTTNETHADFSLISTLLSSIGFLLGGLVDGLTWILTFGQVELNLHDILSNLLNARAEDPTALATGAFAGRIIGKVLVDKCAVTGTVQVNNINDYTGGFVGYMEGATEYDGLSTVLGGIVDVLAALLNVIPGLGLGDLITILLGNVVDVKTLIPTGYVEPKITNCDLSGLTGVVGGDGQDYSGGFVGQEIGALMVNNTISNSNYTVKANFYGGGFAGVARDAEVEGTLGLDSLINIDASAIPRFQTQSLLMECDILDSTVRVEGTQNLGGFVGVLANSYAINNTVDCDTDSTTGEPIRTLVVTGTKKQDGAKTIPAVNVGGFAGYATLGWGASLGGDTAKKDTLLGAVSTLLMGLLGDKEKEAEQQQLLSLAGVAPSAILGCQVDFDSIVISADGSYAGGMVGKADAVVMGKSDDEYVNELSFWKYGDAAPLTEAQKREDCSIDGLVSVTSGHNYAGGVAGYVGTASAGGLLDSTLGLARFIGFTVDGVTVNGVEAGYTVTATGANAGGGIGAAVGGMVDNVQINALKSVTAFDRAAGFIGIAGPGDLVDAGGLQLSLLGLDILEIDNLLAVGQGVEVEITDSNVNGIPEGFTVEATGTRPADDKASVYTAAGFIADSNSTSVMRCSVNNLLKVTAADTAGYAGGFLGISETGGLTELLKQKDDEDGKKKKALLDVIKANGLLNLVAYLIPDYQSCTVHYVDGGGVQADVAGGFVANMQSGTVNNAALDQPYSVYNIAYANGQSYAGGFGGIVQSGALATAGEGLSILGTGDYSLIDLGIDATQVLSLVEAYVPFVEYAGVKSDDGFTVTATRISGDDLEAGSAGGFIGYASGAQISYCDVTKLKGDAVDDEFKVVPPEELEAVEADSYFNGSSKYAVTGGRYAGGYFGNMDIGSAASVGGGLKILGETIKLTNVLEALSVVVTTVEHSDVYGGPGGFAVLANGTDEDGAVGMAGGFAGNISGGHVQDSNVDNFCYIIGQIAAGGYVGNMVPGNVAKVLNDTSILGGLVDGDEALASVAEDFVPTIRNSSTAAVPCGGAVRAHAASDERIMRGMAGGYVGHNEGGSIWGNNDAEWKDENTETKNDLGITVKNYSGEKRPCEAIRIRSVYGYEYAGGFSGLMETADTAETGSLNLLGGVIAVNNLLGALSIVYPTDENTAVYGPLAKLDYKTWNNWVEYIGKNGSFGSELAEIGTVKDQEALDEILSKYIYGYTVVAGRPEYDIMAVSNGGTAGGYVGMMISGTITNGQAYHAKEVRALASAGGYAGRMSSGGAATFGSVSILGLELELGKLISVAQVFVPVIKGSSVQGYQSGLTVKATGTDFTHSCGYAGGYAGSVYGAQIWGEGSGCNVTNLRRVEGTNAIGGYVGLATAASVADVNTNASTGLLQSILDFIISAPSDLLSVLNVTTTTIKNASVSGFDNDWGFVVDGEYQDDKGTQYANYAGGFAGALEAAILGDDAGGSKLNVKGLRSVDGGLYAGGFFGLADVNSVATVAGDDTKTEEKKSVSILDLIQLGQTDVLSAFRTYIYYADVAGVAEGICVRAHETDVEGILSSTRYRGCAGGFGGGMMNGSVKNSDVTNLNTVEGPNYVGGFIGHLGKNGVVNLDSASVLSLLSLGAGVLDVFGSHVDDCTVAGIADGYIVKAQGGQESIAAGFAGYADVSKINDSTATNLKQVVSDQIAGGFAGIATISYLVDVDAKSPLLDVITFVLNKLLDALYVDKAENLGVIKLGEWLGIEEAFDLEIMADGNLLYVNLFGLRIGVSLAANDRLHVQIGDSEINLNYAKGDEITKDDLASAEIKLIKGNMTEVNDCSVTGISVGYDVFGGGATQDAVGTHDNGFAGGFVGLNREGKFQRNNMYLCDTISGTLKIDTTGEEPKVISQVGPFSGYIDLKTVYASYTEDDLEGYEEPLTGGEDDVPTWNYYRIYRSSDAALGAAKTNNNTQFSTAETQTGTSAANYMFPVTHLDVIDAFVDLKDATADGYGALNVYQNDGFTVVLMGNSKTEDNYDSLVPEPAEMPDPCDEHIDLTVQKVWDDKDNKYLDRPGSITLEIYRNYTLDGASESEKVDTITLSKSNVGHSEAIWSDVVEDLAVCGEHTDAAGNQVICYYTYTVKEIGVKAYTTNIASDTSFYVARITNVHEKERIYTEKTVEATDDPNEFVLTLEAYAKELNSSETVTKPADIVLVLDHSGSMRTPMGASAVQHSPDTEEGYAGELYNGPGQLTKDQLDPEKGQHIGYYVAQSKQYLGWFVMEYRETDGKWHAYSVPSTEAIVNPDKEIGGSETDHTFEQSWRQEDINDNLVFYKSQYAALYDAVHSFAANLKASDAAHRVAIVGFAGVDPLGNGFSTAGTGIYVGGDEATFKKYTALHHVNTTDEKRAELYVKAMKDVQDSAEYAQLLSNIEAINTNYSYTCPSVGLEMAADLLAANPVNHVERDQIVILFTDGIPNQTIKGGQNAAKADILDEIVAKAHDIKELGAEVYAISTATLDDENRTFLSYASSDYPDATSYENHGDPIDSVKYTYKVTEEVKLENIFNTITQSTITNLDNSMILREVLTDYFVLNPDDQVDVTVYTAPYLGNGDYGERTKLEGAVVNLTSSEHNDRIDTVEVSGFDYYNEHISEEGRGENKDYYGSKLIVEVRVKTRDGFWGGNNVPTNDPTTGIYTKNGLFRADFPEPEVNVPVVDIEIKDKTIYYGGDIKGEDLIIIDGEEITIDDKGNIVPKEPWMDDYVDVTFTDDSTKPGDELDNTNPEDYHFEIQITPKGDGTKNSQDDSSNIAGEPVAPETFEDEGHVYILVPEVTFKDSYEKLGTATEGYDYSKNYVSTEWVNMEKDLPEGTVVPAVSGTAPTLTLTYSPMEGDAYFLGDTKIEVTITSSDPDGDISKVTTFKWQDCGHSIHQGVGGEKIADHLANELNKHEFWIHVLKPDTVVIDYGLPVKIHPLSNDIADTAVTVNAVLNGIGAAGAKEFGATYAGTFGNAVIEDSEKNAVKYTLDCMEINDIEIFTYQGSYTYGEQTGTAESTITVIPATIVYYEEDFISYSSYTWNTETKGWVLDETSKWTLAGETVAGVQDEDRPGQNLDMPDADNIYGYDDAYGQMSEYSMGSAMKVTVDDDHNAVASFSFYGTGFDVVSLTSNKTGTIQVVVKNAQGQKVKDHTVDTYYGYAHVDTDGDEVEDSWQVVSSENENALYQVPVMKVEGLKYGMYTVEIKALYTFFFDQGQYGNGGKYDFYLDAIRIYDPANDGAGNETIQDAYVADKEGWPLFEQLRNLILDAGTFNDGTTVADGIVFIDGDATVGDIQIKDYQNFGPNNELYLAKGQSIAFQLDAGAYEDILADVQIGIKSADGKNVKYSICKVGADGKLDEQSAELTTATDMYYSIMNHYDAENHAPIVISNTGSDGVISITNIKFTFRQAPGSAQEPGEEETEAPTEAIETASFAGVNTYSLSAVNTGAAVMTASNDSTVEDTVVDAASFIYMTGEAAAMTLRVLNHEAAGYVAYNANDDAYFTDLSDALSAADSGDTVQLVAGTAESVVIVPANVTFDLNGNVVEAGNVMSFGAVIDTAAEVGGIKIDIDETKAFTNLQPGNAGYLPIYNTTDGTYKFFAYELRNKGTKQANGAAKFGIAIIFENVEAYSILANTANSGMELKADLTWTDMSVPSLGYVIPVSAVKLFAEKAYTQLTTTDKTETTYAITLTVSGLSNLESGDFVAAAPSISTIAGVGTANEAIVYTIPET